MQVNGKMYLHIKNISPDILISRKRSYTMIYTKMRVCGQTIIFRDKKKNKI